LALRGEEPVGKKKGTLGVPLIHGVLKGREKKKRQKKKEKKSPESSEDEAKTKKG